MAESSTRSEMHIVRHNPMAWNNNCKCKCPKQPNTSCGFFREKNENCSKESSAAEREPSHEKINTAASEETMQTQKKRQAKSRKKIKIKKQ
jgi:hypothetical protein